MDWKFKTDYNTDIYFLSQFIRGFQHKIYVFEIFWDYFKKSIKSFYYGTKWNSQEILKLKSTWSCAHIDFTIITDVTENRWILGSAILPVRFSNGCNSVDICLSTYKRHMTYQQVHCVREHGRGCSQNCWVILKRTSFDFYQFRPKLGTFGYKLTHNHK